MRLHAILPYAIALVLLILTVSPIEAQSPPMIALDDPSWRLESSSDGIAIYSSSVPGIRVVPFKAKMTIPGTIEEVSMVLEDIPRRREWIKNFGRSVLLERTSDYDQTEYLHVDVPWPGHDRSALIRVRISVSEDLARATIAGVSVDSHPADTLPLLVRSRIYASTFQMTQVGDNVEVVTLIFVDPRGSIPKWIVNFFTRRVAHGTLIGLRRQVAKRLFSPAQLEAMHQRLHAFKSFQQGRAGTP